MRVIRLALIAVFVSLVLVSTSFAQATIAGVVRDASQAVLPGVTVEAASPALIEKVRSVITDSTGQYRIVDLRPGTYTVTFTLPGFNTVKREGIALAGSFVATVNAEMPVGGLAETLTVTGESPVVDVQSTTQQQVLDNSLIDALPTARSDKLLAVLMPGVMMDRAANNMNQDVGGNTGSIARDILVHGSRGDDSRTMVNGLTTGSPIRGGQNSAFMPNMSAFEEVVVSTSGLSTEFSTGGVMVNLIPKDGGNALTGTFFGNFASGGMAANNFTDELRTAGLATPNEVKHMYDFSGAFGGPLKQDRVWFFGALRTQEAAQYIAGIFNDRNANNPAAWYYSPDTAGERPAAENTLSVAAYGRVVAQLGPKQKIGFLYDEQRRLDFATSMSAITSPEAALSNRFRYVLAVGDWRYIASQRTLVEATVLRMYEPFFTEPVLQNPNPGLIPVNSQSDNLTYRVAATHADTWFRTLHYRTAVSYVTGAHAFKIGFQNGVTDNRQTTFDTAQPVSYRFTNSTNGTPNLITLRSNPTSARFKQDLDIGIFLQDRWTLNRLTLTGGLRFDWFKTSFPAKTYGPSPLTPTRNISFPDTPGFDFKDIDPRVGAVYDLAGDGKTAIKVTLNRYLQGYSNTIGASQISSQGQSLDPGARAVTTTTRTWTDNGDFIPQCDLVNPVANGECGPLANRNFGTAVPGVTVDPEVISGFGNRGYNWEFSAGVQRQVLPRVALDVSYFRRSYGNLVITDNRALAASDYTEFSVTAPVDARLPGGGGYAVSGVYDLRPERFGTPSQDFLTFAKNYGKYELNWTGIDVTTNARLGGGAVLIGGISAGRQLSDNCEVAAQVPEMLFTAYENASPVVWTPRQYCRQDLGWVTQLKFAGSYTIPNIDVQVSGVLQSQIPRPLYAALTVPNATVRGILGRDLSGAAQNIQVQIVEPGSLYLDRMNQLDFKAQKLLRVAGLRAAVGIDLYNALNSNTVLVRSTQYASWLRPQSILQSRIAKVSVQFDF